MQKTQLQTSYYWDAQNGTYLREKSKVLFHLYDSFDMIHFKPQHSICSKILKETRLRLI